MESGLTDREFEARWTSSGRRVQWGIVGNVLMFFICVPAGIPVEEEEEDQDSSIKARLLALVYKIKGQPQRSERESTEEEQAAPCKLHSFSPQC